MCDGWNKTLFYLSFISFLRALLEKRIGRLLTLALRRSSTTFPLLYSAEHWVTVDSASLSLMKFFFVRHSMHCRVQQWKSGSTGGKKKRCQSKKTPRRPLPGLCLSNFLRGSEVWVLTSGQGQNELRRWHVILYAVTVLEFAYWRVDKGGG